MTEKAKVKEKGSAGNADRTGRGEWLIRNRFALSVGFCRR